MNILNNRSRLRMAWFVVVVFAAGLFWSIQVGSETIGAVCGSGILTVAMAYIFGETYRPSGSVKSNYKNLG